MQRQPRNLSFLKCARSAKTVTKYVAETILSLISELVLKILSALHLTVHGLVSGVVVASNLIILAQHT
jgi:hypothetical protein